MVFRLVERQGAIRRDAGRGRPARGARRARGRVHRPLQLGRGDLRRVHPPPPRGPRPPVGPLVARRDHRRRRGRARRRPGRHGERVRHRARRVVRRLPRRAGVRARSRRGDRTAPHDHRRRRVAADATASASRSTPTHRPGPTGSTPRWAGARSTSPSPGTGTCRSRRTQGTTVQAVSAGTRAARGAPRRA